MSVFKSLYSQLNFDAANLSKDQYAKTVANYLLDLEDQLKYMFEHIEEDNLTNQFVKNLTANTITAETINAMNITAKYVSTDWVYGGVIRVNQLVFGGVNGNISYNNLSDKPYIPPPYTDAQSLAAWKASGYATYIDQYGVYTGTITANQITAGKISGDRIYGGTISGVTLSGSTITSYNNTYGGYLEINGGYIWGRNNSGTTVLDIDARASIVNCNHVMCTKINNGDPITSNNIGSQFVSHAGTAGWATEANKAGTATYATSAGSANEISGTIYTWEVTATDTGYGNIDFQGFDNAAGVNYLQANYQRIGTSDVRLKYDIRSLDEIPDELFLSLKAKQFRYKTPIYGEGINFGLIAQEVESAFQKHNLNPYDYRLIEVKDVRKYTDDGYYVKDTTHRLNYENIITWNLSITQKLYKEFLSLKEEVQELKKGGCHEGN